MFRSKRTIAGRKLVQRAMKLAISPCLKKVALLQERVVFCPLSSVLCPLSSVFCLLSSVLCPPRSSPERWTPLAKAQPWTTEFGRWPAPPRPSPLNPTCLQHHTPPHLYLSCIGLLILFVVAFIVVIGGREKRREKRNLVHIYGLKCNCCGNPVDISWNGLNLGYTWRGSHK